MQNKNHKLAAIVFTDIVGYTRQMEADEQKTMQLLQQQREIVFPLVKEYHGEVIKEIGDGLLMMFKSSVDAVHFAIKVQQKLKDEELTIRAGIHMGDVIFKDGDVFGSAVNTAARIEPMAEPNGICISESVKNQLGNKDIRMISCGNKELKGVNRPMELFEVFVEGVTQEKKVTVGSFIKDVWQRNVIQIAAIYLLAAWVVKLAVSFVIAKNFYSPHIVELVWIILLSLIPTVLIVSYFHGRGRQDKWHKAELIGMPSNFVLSALLIFILFNGKDLGAATQAVIIQNEDGENIERQVIKNEFHKKLCLFNLENRSGDSSLNWMQFTLPIMIEFDLAQDVFMRPLSSIKFHDELKASGYDDGIGIPLSLMKKLAARHHLQYFMTGSFDFKNGEYITTTLLYETKNGKLIEERSFTEPTLFKISDAISIKVREDMGIPLAHIEQTTDLDVSDIFTKSELALKYYSFANDELILGNWYKALDYFEMSVKEDPDCLVSHMSMVSAYFSTNQMDKAVAALDIIMDQIDRIPDRMQFQIKFAYYLINQEPEKANAVIKMWADLYPDDTEAHAMLAQRYKLGDKNDKAIAEYKTILQIDPERYEYLTEIGRLYGDLDKLDSAILYFQMYAEKFPKDHTSYLNIGDYYFRIANYTEAKEYYEKASLIEISDISIARKLAQVEYHFGHFNAALHGYEKALKLSKNSADSAMMYDALSSYYRWRGELKKSVDYFEIANELKKGFTLPLQIAVQKIMNTPNYISSGKEKEIFEYLDKAKLELNPPLDKLTSFGYLFAYIEMGDANRAETYVADTEELAKIFGEEMLLNNVYYGMGRIHELRGDYNEAILSFNKFLTNQPHSYLINRILSRIYRKMGDYEKAEENINKALMHAPFSAKTNFEAALLYVEIEKTEQAIEHLKIAQEILENADLEFDLVKDVKTKLDEYENIMAN